MEEELAKLMKKPLGYYDDYTTAIEAKAQNKSYWFNR